MLYTSGELQLGAAFIDDLVEWYDAYDYEKQTILGQSLDKNGDIIKQDNNDDKIPLKGLGAAAVLICLLGKRDRHDCNYGVIDCKEYFQIKLYDFDSCYLQFLHLNREKIKRAYENPRDIIRRIFEQYVKNDPNTFPLPPQFYQSKRILCEIYETIDALRSMNANELEKLFNLFKDYPCFKSYMIMDISAGINYLSHKIPYNDEFKACLMINYTFKQCGSSLKLSDFDDNVIQHLLNLANCDEAMQHLYRLANFLGDRRNELINPF